MKHGKSKRLIDSYPYSDCSIAVATMHQKETVIEPCVREFLKAHCRIPPINTDSLGTFCPKVARKDTILNTVIKKAHMGMQEAELCLGIASEGSFFTDYLTLAGVANHEVMVFIDTVRDLTIIEESISYDTNFQRYEIHKPFEMTADFKEFLLKSRFNSHALMVCGSENGQITVITKGITDQQILVDEIKKLQSSGFTDIALETDMRAHCNPTRMKHIKALARKLMKRVATLCKACNAPGFGITQLIRGLPCSLCNNPTDLIKEEQHSCLKCSYTQSQLYQLNPRYYAEPYECSLCNP